MPVDVIGHGLRQRPGDPQTPVRSPGGDEIRQALADAMGAPPEAMTGMVPLSRFGEPEEVAEMVALLVSDRGRWITMHNYFVDGGLGAK